MSKETKQKVDGVMVMVDNFDQMLMLGVNKNDDLECIIKVDKNAEDVNKAFFMMIAKIVSAQLEKKSFQFEFIALVVAGMLAGARCEEPDEVKNFINYLHETYGK